MSYNLHEQKMKWKIIWKNVHLKKQKGSQAHGRAVLQKVAPFHIYIKFAFLIPGSDFTSRAMCNKNSCLNNLNPQFHRVTSTLEERVQRSPEQRLALPNAQRLSRCSLSLRYRKLMFLCVFSVLLQDPVGLLPQHRLVHTHPGHGHVQGDPRLRHDQRHLLQVRCLRRCSLPAAGKTLSSEGQLHPPSPNHP